MVDTCVKTILLLILFLGVGCANGLLLESLTRWCGERGHTVEPHGVDFVPELVDLARARHPGKDGQFEVANAFYWRPACRWPGWTGLAVEADRSVYFDRASLSRLTISSVTSRRWSCQIVVRVRIVNSVSGDSMKA